MEEDGASASLARPAGRRQLGQQPPIGPIARHRHRLMASVSASSRSSCNSHRSLAAPGAPEVALGAPPAGASWPSHGRANRCRLRMPSRTSSATRSTRADIFGLGEPLHISGTSA
eukprot:scaffold18750_cov113-Isochrysis_galbana.AAC.9